MHNTRFTYQWHKLQKETQFYWKLLEELPSEVLSRQPATDQWSILQIMEHLAGAEESGLRYMIKKNYTPVKTKSMMPAFMRSFLLNVALRSPLKFKAPNIEALVPPNTTTPEKLLQHWQEVRQELALFIENTPDTLAAEPLFRHPTAGPLNLKQLLEFMKEHLYHHRRQVNALLSQKSIG